MSLVDALTAEQQVAVERIAAWFSRPRPQDGLMTLGGYAGTGKTTLINQLSGHLGLEPSQVVYCAYTGKAALRLPQGQTIHRLIYHPKDRHCEKCQQTMQELGRCHNTRCAECQPAFMLRESIGGVPALIIVDEASMVTEKIFEDLTSFDVPVLWVGDHGQLPPIKSSFNLMESPTVRLETIHRQVADSPILQLAYRARTTGWIPFARYGPGVEKRCWDGDPADVDTYDLVLCGRNRTRVAVNAVIRERRGFPADRPVVGDKVVCLANDYDVGVFNGQTGVLVDVEPAGATHWQLSVQLDGVSEVRVVEALREQFGEEKTLGVRHEQLWDYGYALTVHKAQGSEADRVMLFEQPMAWGKGSGRLRARWLYTGITRAKRELTVIGRAR